MQIRHGALGAVLATIGGTVACAGAARADEAPGRLDEVVVTAQKREQSLQDVPVSVTAVSGDELVALGAEGLRTFAGRTPGLQLIEASPVDTQIVMRGVVSSRVTRDQVQNKATVGLYMDDVPLEVAANNHNFQLFDMERVEVLRGPQGTLFGAGAMGGAIRYITRKPDASALAGDAGVRVATTKSGSMTWAADGVLNVPVVHDALGVRLLGYTSHYGGYLDNLGTGKNNSDDVDIEGYRASLRFTPSDALRLDLTAAHQRTRLDDAPVMYPELGDLKRYSFAPEWTAQTSDYVALTATADLGRFTLASVTGYQSKDQDNDFDVQGFNPLLGLPLDLIALTIPTASYSHGFSQEIRLQTNPDERLAWTLGVFYSKQLVGLTQALIAPGIEALGFPPGSAFGVGTDYLFDAKVESDTRQYAVFAQADFALTSRLRASVGARYFDATDRSDFDLRGLLQGGVFDATPRLKENGINPSFSLDYRIADDAMLYARAAEGFRLGGGNNPIPEALCGADLAAIGLTRAPTTFNSDSLWNFELGMKSSWLDGRARINAAAYFIIGAI